MLLFAVLVAAIAIGSVFIVPVLYSPYGNAERKKKIKVIACILVLIFGVADYYMISTIGFLNHISSYVDEGASDRTEAHAEVTEEAFNVLVSRIDVTGDINETVSRSDVNMVVTINPNSREVLITSIPRDYYVELPGYGAMDKLTHTGIYGAEESIGAVEELLGIDINYYAKVNYSTITGLVDAIGGIDIVSPYSFDTHGMGVSYHFEEGKIHLDGDQALAYCRERKSWIDGDMKRNENQQLILEAIIKKITRGPVVLVKYPAILDAIKGTVETDMSKDDMTELVKMQLSDMRFWDITKQAIKGTPDFAECYSIGDVASVVMPDYDSIYNATELIDEIAERE
jgi:LCP family protein required for cell wall assembly